MSKQEALARLAGVTRLKVIAIEAGRSSVAIESHAKLDSALGAVLTLLPRTRPPLDVLPPTERLMAPPSSLRTPATPRWPNWSRLSPAF